LLRTWSNREQEHLPTLRTINVGFDLLYLNGYDLRKVETLGALPRHTWGFPFSIPEFGAPRRGLMRVKTTGRMGSDCGHYSNRDPRKEVRHLAAHQLAAVAPDNDGRLVLRRPPKLA
jgi:hypothetical protein